MKKAFGPGILFAATAIGVSHLVQSTRAGASFGWALLLIIVLANVVKFPFFEFGTRYANGTGTSLIEGYKKQSKAYLWMYTIVTVLSMFTVTGAVSVVTAGLIAHLTGLGESMGLLTAGIFVLCFIWLALGKYKFLDISIKVITGVLFLSTLIAFMSSVATEGFQYQNSSTPQLDDASTLLFIVALIGWMPTAVDLSVWNSIWTVEKMKSNQVQPSKKEVLLDFNIGYWLSAVSAILFLGLGAMIMFPENGDIPTSAVGFTQLLISMYTNVLGSGFYYVIVLSASAAMFSTTLSVFDGYGRTLEELSRSLNFKWKLNYWISVLIVAVGGWLLVVLFQQKMTALIDVAMFISFLVAPLIGYLNWKLVNSDLLPKLFKPSRILNLWALISLLVLVGLTVLFLVVRLSL